MVFPELADQQSAARILAELRDGVGAARYCGYVDREPLALAMAEKRLPPQWRAMAEVGQCGEEIRWRGGAAGVKRSLRE